ncbi:rRNA maturation RNase YbeY [Algoriphagus hitonicola]|uniref:Endoribonuclease YbeY n=1 Tax=Algoriphagus hitonicola TaxID=435880 RepID=A0A1I2SH86_9BACT|nr:rRNA maturation RNase YbeY [Algoriphagus hitonicola]SFG52030.1 rRNA maturation RNase YbeY [Algoriphagus hitonicola]
MAIHFFDEDSGFDLPQKLKRKKWLNSIADSEGYKIKDLNYIFCSDEYLYQINVNYLQHKTYTDIITFDNSEKEREIEGDIFISFDRVKENATQFNFPLEEELNRVLSHGLFHLLGYKDKKKSEAELMRNKEQFAITLYKNM